MNKFLSLWMMIGLLFVGNPTEIKAQEERLVKISTDFGDMTVKLYNDTPLHRDNFVKLVQQGFYDGTLFHRTIPYFMAQGGDPNSKNAPLTQPLGVDNCGVIPAEIRPNHFHKKGALAAARLPDASNPTKQSSGCQFFVVQGYKHNDQQIDANERPDRKFSYFQRAWYKVRGGYPFLDMDYTVFGEIVDGLEVLDMIMAVPTSQEPATKDRPLMNIAMNKVTMLN
ncbi:MAG: peptidylprolyl isomerase [Bacteroidota bacterium]